MGAGRKGGVREAAAADDKGASGRTASAIERRVPLSVAWWGDLMVELEHCICCACRQEAAMKQMAAEALNMMKARYFCASFNLTPRGFVLVAMPDRHSPARLRSSALPDIRR